MFWTSNHEGIFNADDFNKAKAKSAAAEGGTTSVTFRVSSNGLKHGAGIAEKKRLRKDRRRNVRDNAANAAESYAPTLELMKHFTGSQNIRSHLPWSRTAVQDCTEG